MRRERRRIRRARPGAVPLAVLLAVAAPRQARAEDSVAYKYIDYSETAGRIDVRTQVVAVNQEIGLAQLGVVLTDDAISGASPDGTRPNGPGPVPLVALADHRKAWEADLARPFGTVTIEAGVSESREHDYVSRGWSLNTRTDLNQKNTTLLAGIAGHADEVKTYILPERFYEPKHALSAILGVVQVIDPATFVTVNLTGGRESGDLNDQYKVVEKTEELVPGSFFQLGFHENLPAFRNLGAVLVAVNHAVPSLAGAVEASFRFYEDSFGVAAGTAELRWLQKAGSRLTLAPEARVHEQGAARFYHYDLDPTDILPTRIPNPSGPNYSSDYRLSSLYTTTLGIKLSWAVSDRVGLDLAYDRYAMHGCDGITPASAYPTANILSAGGKVSW